MPCHARQDMPPPGSSPVPPSPCRSSLGHQHKLTNLGDSTPKWVPDGGSSRHSVSHSRHGTWVSVCPPPQRGTSRGSPAASLPLVPAVPGGPWHGGAGVGATPLRPPVPPPDHFYPVLGVFEAVLGDPHVLAVKRDLSDAPPQPPHLGGTGTPTWRGRHPGPLRDHPPQHQTVGMRGCCSPGRGWPPQNGLPRGGTYPGVCPPAGTGARCWGEGAAAGWGVIGCCGVLWGAVGCCGEPWLCHGVM